MDEDEFLDRVGKVYDTIRYWFCGRKLSIGVPDARCSAVLTNNPEDQANLCMTCKMRYTRCDCGERGSAPGQICTHVPDFGLFCPKLVSGNE